MHACRRQKISTTLFDDFAHGLMGKKISLFFLLLKLTQFATKVKTTNNNE